MNAKLLFLSLTCAAGLAVDARAQLFGPEASRNILLGATAGYLWSAATAPQDRRAQAIYRNYPSRQVVVVREASCPPPVRVVYVRRHRPHYERVVYVRPPVRERAYVYASSRDCRD